MSESKKRKVYTPEFKAKIGLEALRGIKTINEIGLLIKQRQIYIPTATRYIALGLNYGTHAPPVFRTILSHALTTLAIND